MLPIIGTRDQSNVSTNDESSFLEDSSYMNELIEYLTTTSTRHMQSVSNDTFAEMGRKAEAQNKQNTYFNERISLLEDGISEVKDQFVKHISIQQEQNLIADQKRVKQQEQMFELKKNIAKMQADLNLITSEGKTKKTVSNDKVLLSMIKATPSQFGGALNTWHECPCSSCLRKDYEKSLSLADQIVQPNLKAIGLAYITKSMYEFNQAKVKTPEQIVDLANFDPHNMDVMDADFGPSMIIEAGGRTDSGQIVINARTIIDETNNSERKITLAYIANVPGYFENHNKVWEVVEETILSPQSIQVEENPKVAALEHVMMFVNIVKRAALGNTEIRGAEGNGFSIPIFKDSPCLWAICPSTRTYNFNVQESLQMFEKIIDKVTAIDQPGKKITFHIMGTSCEIWGFASTNQSHKI